MRKLILRCGLALGDIVMLTAAVRDLHKCYPKRFQTDVRTAWPDLWTHNPYLTPLSEDDQTVEQLESSYPLIDHCNETPYHCLHGFIHFLNNRLRLSIKPTAFKGDIHLSKQEKLWYSQVREVTGQDTPFWIIAAGGKHDVTIKWWETSRFQAVVDHFRGKIQFVQVGHSGHHHPKLNGVIDLRGDTNLRELIRLVYHSDGVLCPVTSLMHLAAAVERKAGHPANRPCVVIAGGREPAHWEAYPGHQFIHTNDTLPCCAGRGCWRDRTVPLRDGDKRDHRNCLCVDVIQSLPRCMDMISAQDVIRRIDLYYAAGHLKPLSPIEAAAAECGVERTAKNFFDSEPLNLHSAGLSCDTFARRIPTYPDHYAGRGVVICAGGIRYFTNAWVCINVLRRLGCSLPIQLWHFGKKELDERMRDLVTPLGVECIDAYAVRRKHPARILRGWELKPYAILHSPFREVLFLDADNVPVVNPEFLFETREFKATGAIFWPDYTQGRNKQAAAVWRSCGLRQPREPEFETGQIVLDKQRCWHALCLTLWFNENSDFYYQYVHGDKETFHLAFRKVGKRYSLVPTPIYALPGTMCQHDFRGRRILQHRNCDKWDLLPCNRRIPDFWLEEECMGYLAELRRVWGGRTSQFSKGEGFVENNKPRRSLRIEAVMISCEERNELRRRTLENLSKTDWADLPLRIQIDDGHGSDHRRRQTRCALLALKSILESSADYILFLEDDLDFSLHFRHNLYRWLPLRNRTATLASVYNPRLKEIACDLQSNSRILSPESVFGSQAFVMSKATVHYVVDHWNKVRGMQDIRISRLAGRLGKPILYHAPSLVQHIGATSVWGAKFHQAIDFDPHWRA